MNMELFTPEEEKYFYQLLSKMPDDAPIAYLEELHGLLFGLAITPEIIPSEEWTPLVISVEAAFDDEQDMEIVTGHLLGACERMRKDSLKGKLIFPFDYDRMTEEDFDMVTDWVYGLFMALSLRPDIWAIAGEIDEDTYDRLPEETRAVLDAFTVVASIAVPESMEETFKDILQEEGIEKEELMGRFYGELPFSVEALQEYSAGIRRDISGAKAPKRVRKNLSKRGQEKKNADNDLCPCGSGKAYKKCCGAN